MTVAKSRRGSSDSPQGGGGQKNKAKAEEESGTGILSFLTGPLDYGRQYNVTVKAVNRDEVEGRTRTRTYDSSDPIMIKKWFSFYSRIRMYSAI